MPPPLLLLPPHLPVLPAARAQGAGCWSARGQGRPPAVSSSPAQHRAARGGEWTEGAGVAGGRAAAHIREEEFVGAEGDPGDEEADLQAERSCPLSLGMRASGK